MQRFPSLEQLSKELESVPTLPVVEVEVKKHAREVVRDSAERQKKWRRESAAKSRAQAAETLQKVQQSFLRPSGVAQQTLRGVHDDSLSFFRTVHEKAPRLVVPENKQALLRLSKITPVRRLEDWAPVGKGRDTLFRSLCSHLLARYPMPPFLWTAFYDAPGYDLGPERDRRHDVRAILETVVGVAGGTSLFKLCKEGTFPIPLTRAQCHEFMGSSSDLNLMTAVRRVQVKAEGGDRRLLANWMRIAEATQLGSPDHEAFWLTVLRFFAHNPMLDTTQMGPLCDLIRARRRGNPLFAMQGRTAESMLKALREWHGDLAKAKDISKAVFTASGFLPLTIDKSVEKNGFVSNPEIWTFTEVLTSADLIAEGKDLRHCVYSYAWQVSDRRTSIWSLSVRGFGAPERRLTIEVTNGARTIVQVRGKTNRLPNAQENKLITQWAVKNNLTIQSGGAW